MSPAAPTSVAELELALGKSEQKVAERGAQIRDLRKRNAALVADLKKLRREFTVFRDEVKRLLGHVPKSKQLSDKGQLPLFGDTDVPEALPEEYMGDTPEADEDAGEDELDKPKRKKRAKKTDRNLLPHTIVRHEMPEEQRVCPDTGIFLVPVGVEITEELDYVAAELRVIEHHRAIYGPPPEVAEDRQVNPIKAPMPLQPLEGCGASAALLVHLLVQKYVFHLPLYRQEEVFQQAGLFLARSTLCDWVMKAAFALGPIARAIENSIRAGPVLQLDDTLVKCQVDKTDASDKGIRQAYLWSFVNPKVVGVAFRFTEGRAASDLAPLLVGSSGSILLGDAYAGNKAAAREAGLKFEYAGCWAHVLRKFKDARNEAPSMVRLFRADLRKLYDIEDAAEKRKLDSKARRELRQERGRPLIARILARTLGWKETFSLSGKMAEAIKYLRNNRKALLTYLSNGDVPIDNNACERSIRPIAIGRRNWLFVGSVEGGHAAATVFTMIESCKAADIELVPYLTDVLLRVATHPASKIDELTPARWRATDVVATVR